MDVKVFKTFLEVANTRHFSKAADNLFITAAAVSARIKQLEAWVDAPLFERGRNNIQLTEAGRRLIPFAKTMVRSLQQARDSVSTTDADIRPLSIAATPNVWDALLQGYLTTITDACPTLNFRTEMTSAAQLHAGVIDRTTDLTLSLDPFLAEDVVSQRITELELILVSTDSYITIEQVFSSDYVMVDWGLQFLTEHHAFYDEIPPAKLHTSTGRIALDYILEKGGSAYLPEPLVDRFIDHQQLFIVDGQYGMSRPVFANYRKDSLAATSVRQVIDVIRRARPRVPYIIESAAQN